MNVFIVRNENEIYNVYKTLKLAEKYKNELNTMIDDDVYFIDEYEIIED